MENKEEAEQTVETREQVKASLDKKLGRRSSVEELEQAVILKDPAKVAAAIQPFQKSIQQQVVKNQLKELLAERPSENELKAKGILVSPSSDAAANQIYNYISPEKSKIREVLLSKILPNKLIPERSAQLVLIRILLRFVTNLEEIGEINAEQKGKLKDMVIKQDPVIMRAAKHFDVRRDVAVFRDNLRSMIR